MRTTATKWAAKAAGTGVMAILLAAPAFAQSRSDWNRNNNSNRGAQATDTRGDNNRQYQRSNQNQPQYQQNQAQHQQNQTQQFNNDNRYRETQRSNETGRITSFARERDGYRVGLDRGRSYWVPESRGRGLRVGLSINLGSLFGYPAGYGYDNGYVRGVIDRVDYRTGTVWLQDDRSGAEIRAAVGSRYALRDLHRGEFVELTGQWIGGGVFDVARIASIR